MTEKYYFIKENNLNNRHHNNFRLDDFFFILKIQIMLLLVVSSSFFLVTRSINAKIYSPLAYASVVEPSPQPEVLGTNIVNSPEALPSPTLTPSPQPTQLVEMITPEPIRLSKNSYSIAIIGDSMVDTMGERLEYLEHALKKKYPNVNFTLYNFGQGAQNVEDGLARLHNRLDHQDRRYPSLDEIKPDVLIVGSFSYNPFSPHDPERYKSSLSRFINEAKTISGQTYVLAEIAPLKVGFGKGPGGVNWDDNTSYQQATKIIEQMETAIAVSQSESLPLINAFNPSQAGGDKSGNPKYVNSNDGIHPSVLGHEFMADIIANSLRLN